MTRERVWYLVVGIAAVAVVLTLAVEAGLVTLPTETDREAATVRLVDQNGTTLATVETGVADTPRQRYDGLSGTDSLANGTGLLFVHDRERSLTYVMRGMNYGLDIVFVDADGRVTAVRSAPPPGPDEDGSDIRRSGRGKYVLEVPRGYAERVGLDVGDRVEITYHEAKSGI